MSLTIARTSSAHHTPRAPVVTPSPKPQVESASLAERLTRASRSLQKNATGTNRDPRFAGPHREAIWGAAEELLAARPQGTDLARLRAPLLALRDFVVEFGGFRESGDQHLQARIFAGASPARPGLIGLVEGVLAAAGMGRIGSWVDHAGF